MTSMEVAVAVVPILIGQVLLFLVRKRQMDRSNEYGVEVFPSFTRKAGALTLDYILFISGHILVMTGLVTIAFASHEWYSWLALPLLLWVSSDLLKGMKR